MGWRASLGLCGLILLAGEVRSQETETVAVQSISAAMQEFVDSHVISGAVTLVGRQGKVVHQSEVGFANLADDRPMQRDTIFAVASMTKPIVATAVMILHDEGKLNVNDEVAKYLPSFADTKTRDGVQTQPITLRDCVTHTSGLAGNQTFDGSLAEAAEELAQRPLAFAPGERWQYSPGLNVAGRVVEVVSGQPLEEFLQQRIFQPLGMTNTTFFPSQEQLKRIATIYAPADSGEGLVSTGNFISDPTKVTAPNPSGGLFSTAEDLFRFYQMMLGVGKLGDAQILSAQSVKQMTTNQIGELQPGFTPGNGWGLGWCLVREPQGVSGMLSPGTFGHGGAFGTQGWIDPQRKMIFVLLLQRTKLPNSDDSEMRKVFQQLAVDQFAD